jgi:hypothetical protein
MWWRLGTKCYAQLRNWKTQHFIDICIARQNENVTQYALQHGSLKIYS